MFDLHHTTLSTIAVVATLLLLVVVVVAWKLGLISPTGRDEELEMRIAVASSYVKSAVTYIRALEGATQAVLDLKSPKWRPQEKKEIDESHTLLASRVRTASSMFQRSKQQ